MLSARTLTTTAALLLAGTVWVTTTDTLGGFSAARVTNDTNSAKSALLSVGHSYNSTTCSATAADTSPFACGSAISPTSVPTTGSGSVADTITNNGTYASSGLTAKYRVAGCGAVQLANSGSTKASGALLPRTGTTFSPTGGKNASMGAITFDGTKGYASAATQVTEQNGPTGALYTTKTFGLGIWFNTTSTAVSPLIGFGSSPLNVTGTDDRILYLNAGKIQFAIMTSTGTTVTSSASTTAYNDGKWHFAWVSISTANVLSVGNNFSVTVNVDGASAATIATQSLSRPAANSGYWRLGWAPVGGSGKYFAGALSDFVVDDSGSAPTNPTAPTTNTALTGTEQWYLNDTGLGTFNGTSLSGVATSGAGGVVPCDNVDVSWTVGTTTAASGTLTSAVSASGTTVSFVNPTATQTSTIALTRHTGFNAYVSGLMLAVPIQITYSVTAAPSWSITFQWGTSTTVTVA